MTLVIKKGFSRGYVTDENIKQVCRTFAKLLCQIDGAFSCLRKVEPTRERIREAGNFVSAFMKTWRKLGLSVTPKSNIFEYHAIESMQALNIIVNKTKYFIELSHQDGARQDRRTQGLMYYNKKHDPQHKAEHRASPPKVHKVKGK